MSYVLKLLKLKFIMNKNKGFTLIELLVVIAIIGILASVVLASLNSARNKASDVAVKTNLANARAQAELFYDSNGNTYNPGLVTAAAATNLCSSSALTTNGSIVGINKNVLAAAKAQGVTSVSVGVQPTSTNAVCSALGQSWYATAPLKNPTTAGNVFCVDSLGYSGETAPANLNVTTDFNCQ